ncbi:hypothetical protein [Thiolapillus brandeum]|uniref:Uncharacterized protein n=1 Tax=Thiolapillus brandeum TaxID=1076588 RepID=A0A7U6GKL9_9GAMM|nr:hypothetical protein [Thiolapillus brandeum]BAO45392.1 conserved hypothetical protein [Thiolapillus brandeum]
MPTVPFSERPGRYERHFRRKLDNALFPRPLVNWSEDDLLEVQRLDHEELMAFLQSLRHLVRRAVELKPNEETQVILDLKAELEKHYEQACGLADQQEGNKQAIRQLVEVIMNTIRRNAVGDSLAEQELAEEELARSTHFELLEHPLVADLLHPDSLIEADELAAVLLSDEECQVLAAWKLFDDEQRQWLLSEMGEKLKGETVSNPVFEQRLALLQGN